MAAGTTTSGVCRRLAPARNTPGTASASSKPSSVATRLPTPARGSSCCRRPPLGFSASRRRPAGAFGASNATSPNNPSDRLGYLLMAQSNGARKVLIVDGDSATRRDVRSACAQDGYQVLEADSGAEALRQIESVRPNLVLLEVAQRLRAGVRLQHLVAILGARGADVPPGGRVAVHDQNFSGSVRLRHQQIS